MSRFSKTSLVCVLVYVVVVVSAVVVLVVVVVSSGRVVVVWLFRFLNILSEILILLILSTDSSSESVWLFWVPGVPWSTPILLPSGTPSGLFWVLGAPLDTSILLPSGTFLLSLELLR